MHNAFADPIVEAGVKEFMSDNPGSPMSRDDKEEIQFEIEGELRNKTEYPLFPVF